MSDATGICPFCGMGHTGPCLKPAKPGQWLRDPAEALGQIEDPTAALTAERDELRGEVDDLEAGWDEATRYAGRLMAERDALREEVERLTEEITHLREDADRELAARIKAERKALKIRKKLRKKLRKALDANAALISAMRPSVVPLSAEAVPEMRHATSAGAQSVGHVCVSPEWGGAGPCWICGKAMP